MEITQLIPMWKEYQKWLKKQNINSQNIKERIPEFVNMLKQDPEKLQQAKELLENKTVLSLAKQLKISDSEISEMKNFLGSNYQKKEKLGNLTKEQLDMIKKFKH